MFTLVGGAFGGGIVAFKSSMSQALKNFIDSTSSTAVSSRAQRTKCFRVSIVSVVAMVVRSRPSRAVA